MKRGFVMNKKIIIVLIVSFVFILCSSLAKAQVTISFVNTHGFTDGHNRVYVSLSNPTDKVLGLVIDICDVDNYITCTSCEPTARAVLGEDGFCTVNEPVNGCCSVLLTGDISKDYIIEEGTGPILTLKYDVSDTAPTGECKELILEKAVVVDENTTELDATLSSGEVCFGDSIPTLSEWGFIIFMILILGISVVMLYRRRAI